MRARVECASRLHARGRRVARHGSKTLVVVVLLLYAARCAGYALEITYFPGRPWLVLLVEPLHGITFAFFIHWRAWWGPRRACHPTHLIFAQTRMLAQGLFSAAFNGGAGVGAALGGLGVRRIGYRNTFLVFTAGFVVATVAAFVKLVDDRPPEDERRWQRPRDEFEEDGDRLACRLATPFLARR